MAQSVRADGLALAAMAHVNRPAWIACLSAMKTWLWPSLRIWNGRVRPRRGRYAAKPGLKVAALGDSDALHHRKTRPVDEGKTVKTKALDR